MNESNNVMTLKTVQVSSFKFLATAIKDIL